MTAGGDTKERDEASSKLFLTQEEHLTFQRCTKLNSALDNVLASQPATRAPPNRTFQNRLQVHCELLERRDGEICAIVTSGASIDGQATNASGSLTVKAPRIVIATNNTGPTDYEDKITLTKITSIGACRHNLVHCPHLQYRSNPFKVPFNDHVRGYFRYLRAVHSAPDDPTYDAAVNRFREYVVAACHPSILAAFKVGSQQGRGGKKSNIWEILTCDIPDYARRSPMPRTQRLPTKRRPDGRGTTIIRDFLHGNDEMSTIYKTPEDRLRFHSVLKRVLVQARDAIAQVRFRTTQETVQAACIAMVDLCNFIEVFQKNDFLGVHLMWLAKVANVTHLHDTPDWTAPISFSFGIRRRDWRDAALGFLQMISSDERSLRNAVIGFTGQNSGGRKFEVAMVMQAEVAVFNIDMTKLDDNKMDLDPTIDEAFIKKHLEPHQPDLKAKEMAQQLKNSHFAHHREQRARADSVLANVRRVDEEVVGVIPPEAVLISLIAIAKDEELMSLIDDQWLQQNNNINATKQDLLNFLNNLGTEPVVMSRRENTNKWRRSDLATSLLFSNRSVVTTMPAFIPRELGLPVLRMIKSVTARRLLEWQEKMWIEENFLFHPELESVLDEINRAWSLNEVNMRTPGIRFREKSDERAV